MLSLSHFDYSCHFAYKFSSWPSDLFFSSNSDNQNRISHLLLLPFWGKLPGCAWPTTNNFVSPSILLPTKPWHWLRTQQIPLTHINILFYSLSIFVLGLMHSLPLFQSQSNHPNPSNTGLSITCHQLHITRVPTHQVSTTILIDKRCWTLFP